MAIQNPNNAFKLVERTSLLERNPVQYGRARESSIFTVQGTATTTVRVLEKDGKISVIPMKGRGENPTLRTANRRTARYLDIPHFPLQDRVHAESLQDVVTDDGQRLTSFALEKAQRLQDLNNDLAITEEWLMCKSLSGVLLDNDGSTVIYNFYEQFGKTKKVINFPFSVGTTKVRKLCMDVSRHIEDNLLGDTMTQTEVWCSPNFFDQLIGHSSVEKVFEGHQAAVERLGGDPRKGFSFGGLKFSEYRGKAAGANGVQLNFIEPDKAIAFPMGTRQTFEVWYGPSVLNAINNVNRLGRPRYAFETQDSKGRWAELDVEMNPLPMCKRPEVLVELTMS